MLTIVAFLLIGLGVGAAARWMIPGAAPGGWGASIAVGVLGSMFAGLVGGHAGLYRDGEAAGLVMSLLGATVITIAYHTVVSRRPTART